MTLTLRSVLNLFTLPILYQNAQALSIVFMAILAGYSKIPPRLLHTQFKTGYYTTLKPEEAPAFLLEILLAVTKR